MASITVTFSIPDTEVQEGWFGKLDELALSTKATLHELNGDDGGVYIPQDMEVIAQWEDETEPSVQVSEPEPEVLQRGRYEFSRGPDGTIAVLTVGTRNVLDLIHPNDPDQAGKTLATVAADWVRQWGK